MHHARHLKEIDVDVCLHCDLNVEWTFRRVLSVHVALINRAFKDAVDSAVRGGQCYLVSSTADKDRKRIFVNHHIEILKYL